MSRQLRQLQDKLKQRDIENLRLTERVDELTDKFKNVTEQLKGLQENEKSKGGWFKRHIWHLSGWIFGLGSLLVAVVSYQIMRVQFDGDRPIVKNVGTRVIWENGVAKSYFVTIKNNGKRPISSIRVVTALFKARPPQSELDYNIDMIGTNLSDVNRDEVLAAGDTMLREHGIFKYNLTPMEHISVKNVNNTFILTKVIFYDYTADRSDSTLSVGEFGYDNQNQFKYYTLIEDHFAKQLKPILKNSERFSWKVKGYGQD